MMMGCEGLIDYSPKAPLERTLYTVLIMWLAWQQAGGGWEPTIFSTITAIKPSTKQVLGTIVLGERRLTDDFNPQYVGAVNSHGLGFSRDGKYINSVSVTTNALRVIRTLDNSIVSQTYVDRAPHEGFFSADNRTVWVAARGTNFVDIVDGIKGGIIGRVLCAPGSSKVLFSPDGATAYVNHILSATLDSINVNSQKVVHQITGVADVFSST